jgi:phospholipase/carboxylesterase
MDVLRVGPLRVRRVVVEPEKTTKSSLTVVLNHGFGAPADDLVGLAEAGFAPPGTTLIFPEAPHAVSDLLPLPFFGDARAWWPIDVARLELAIARGEMRDLTRERPDGLPEARAALVAMLDALDVAPGRLVLGGFSQGAMLATDVALRDLRPLAGLVILSGTLIAEDEWVPRMASRAGLRVLQSHGRADPLLPYAIAERLRDALVSAGLLVRFSSFDDGHGIPPSVLDDLADFLRSIE